MRLSRSNNPWVRAAWVEGKRVPVSTSTRLAAFIDRHAPHRMDIDVEYERGERMVGFRVLCSKAARKP